MCVCVCVCVEIKEEREMGEIQSTKHRINEKPNEFRTQ